MTLTHTIFKKGGEPSANIGTVTTETKAIAAGETAAIDATVNAQIQNYGVLQIRRFIQCVQK